MEVLDGVERSFWGASLDSTNKVAVFKPMNGPNVTESLHLTQVVLGSRANGPISLQVTVGTPDPDRLTVCVLCTLSAGRVDQCKVNLVFNSQAAFELVGDGEGLVYISGCKETLGRADGEGKDEYEDDGEDEDEDNEEKQKKKSSSKKRRADSEGKDEYEDVGEDDELEQHLEYLKPPSAMNSALSDSEDEDNEEKQKEKFSSKKRVSPTTFWINIFGSRKRYRTVPAKKAKNVAAPAQSIKDRLQAKFVKYKPSELGSTGLLKDWETYALSLPVRKQRAEFTPAGLEPYEEHVKLYTLSYWGSDEELLTMVSMLEGLETDSSGDRDEPVKYVCAPSKSGKTTSIVPAFLKSKVFTHYLYLAFFNNGGRSFELRPSNPDKDEKVAEEQGAAFAVECVRILLTEPDREWPCMVQRDKKAPPTKESQDAMSKMIKEFLGKECRPLIHVDEHRMMCSRNKGRGAAFARGAMQCLNAAKNTTVVATYTKPPPINPDDESSGMCRRPVVLPRVDIDKVMGHLANQISAGCYDEVTECFTRPITKSDAEWFSFPPLPDEATQPQRRLMATLRLRFAMSLDTAKALGALHRPGISVGVDKFVAAVAGAMHALHHDIDMSYAALTTAITACTIKLSRTAERTVENAHAANLLVGMSDSEMNQLTSGRGLTKLIVLPSGLISSPIAELILDFMISVKVPVFEKGGNRFRALLGSEDLLASAPLEEAYLWALACRSALRGKLSFNGKNFSIQCADIQSGRIFATQDLKKPNNLDDLFPNVMYYADEPGRGHNEYSHPRADMWFRSADDDVVLIDITGGTGATVTDKADKFRTTIRDLQKRQSDEMTGITVHGVILAPADNTTTKTEEVGPSYLITVCGRDARDLLGGLDQLFQYMTPA